VSESESVSASIPVRRCFVSSQTNPWPGAVSYLIIVLPSSFCHLFANNVDPRPRDKRLEGHGGSV
jgi:hypothetical protein